MDGLTGNGVSNLTVVESVNNTSPHLFELLCTNKRDVYSLVRFVCDVIFNVPISIVGLVGNSLAFIVLLQHEPRLGTTLLLQTLAITDNVVITARFFLHTLPTYDVCTGALPHYRAVYGHVFRWLYPTVFVFRMLEVWLVVFVTIERWLCVTYPHRAKQLCSRRRVAVGVVTLVGVSLAVSLPRYFEFRVINGGSWYAQLHHVLVPAYTFTYRIGLFLLSNYLIPMSVLVVLNIQLYRALKRHELWLTGGRKIRLAKMASRALTTIVVAVVMTFIVCNLLPLTAQLLWSLEQSFKMPASVQHTRKLLTMVSNVFVTLNCSINFVIYAVGNSNFRRTFLRLCGIDRSRGVVGPIGCVKGVGRGRGIGGSCSGGKGSSSKSLKDSSIVSGTQHLMLRSLPDNGVVDLILLHSANHSSVAKTSPSL